MEDCMINYEQKKTELSDPECFSELKSLILKAEIP